MQYLLIEWDHDLDDEPYLVYSELDDGRREIRRVEFYRNGISFSYGGERGGEGALAPDPLPEDLRTLRPENEEGAFHVQSIPPSLFHEIWNQAQERPDGFMGMFF